MRNDNSGYPSVIPAGYPKSSPEVLRLPAGIILNLDMQGTGLKELDGSGFSRNGAVTGALSKAVAVGTCRLLDGDDDVITVAGDIIGTGNITVEAWINPSGWGEGGYGRIITNAKFVLALQNATLFASSDDNTTVDSAISSLTLNTWHHIVVTRKSDGKLTYYINGSVSGTADQNSGTPAAGSDVLIGNRAAGDRAFAGMIGSVRLYSRIISSIEIPELYNAGCFKYGLAGK